MVMRIKELRKARGMKQTDLAVLMGVSQSTVSEWDTEFTLPKTKLLPQLAKVFDVTISELFVEACEAADVCNIPS